MELERMIDQLSLPISCDVFGSFSEKAGSSFGQSQESSKIDHNTSSESWMSESSCDCHSTHSSTNSKSHLMFYNHRILPPLLCSITRTEMQTYRRKAVEKEKNRLKKSTTLRQDMESNLSVEVSDDVVPFEQQPEEQAVSNHKSTDVVETEEVVSQNEPETKQIDLASPLACVDPEILNDTNSESSSASENENQESQFQEDAYRHSLQNLLHKSQTMNQTLNTTGSLDQPRNTVSAAKECGDAASHTISTSLATSESCCLEAKQAAPEGATGEASAVNASCEDAPAIEVQDQVITDTSKDNVDENEEKLRLLLDKTAEELVNSVLESVTALPQDGLSPTPNTQPPKTPSESPLKSNSVQCPYFSPRSPCKATEQIDKALLLIENQFLHQYKPEEKGYSESSDSAHQLPTEASFLSHGSLKDSDCSKHHSAQESESVPTETQPHTPELELQIESDSFFESVEQVTPIVSSSVSVPGLCESPPSAPTPETRIRRDSFSVDTPSSLLLSSRITHTIKSENVSSSQSEAKRKLDLHSDSEESLLSNAITDISLQTIQLLDRNSAPNYCKMLEEQHRKEMVELQRYHHEQLTQYREKFLGCQIFSPGQLFLGESKFEQVDPTMHLKWCRLSALVKGHLTRKLLGSIPVQSCMKTIRDTSRTILSMKNEDTSSSTNMSAIQDATLMNRLFSQLRSAMYEFHAFFFATPVSEQMEIISRSREVEARTTVLKEANRSKMPRLSAATQKSLQRKKDIRKRSEEMRSNGSKKNSQNEKHRNPHKEIKSKVSTFWKIDGARKNVSKISKNKAKGPQSNNSSYCSPSSSVSVSRKQHRV